MARDYNLNAVMLSGGCAQNALLRTLLRNELNKHSVRLILPHKAPANDGGLALGHVVRERSHEPNTTQLTLDHHRTYLT